MASNVNDDLYGVLGLKKECTAAELRSAYKKLALRWHPDRCSSMGNSKFVEESKKKFQIIQEAYSVLSDSNKRFLYDVGAYDSEEDQDGMGDFLNEMAAMMNQSKPHENEGESFEELQDLFNEMFKGDSSTSEFSSTTCFPCSTSTYTQSCSFIFDNTNHHQWSSSSQTTTTSPGININMNINSSFGFDPRAHTFSLGVEHQQDFKKGKSGGGGSSSSNVSGRRNRRKHKVSSGAHQASATNNYGVPTS